MAAVSVVLLQSLENVQGFDCSTMGREICKFKSGSKKVLPADSATADSLTFDMGDLWIFSEHSPAIQRS